MPSFVTVVCLAGSLGDGRAGRAPTRASTAGHRAREGGSGVRAVPHRPSSRGEGRRAGRDRGLQEGDGARSAGGRHSGGTGRRCTCGTIALDEAVSTAEQALKIAPANRGSASRARADRRGEGRPPPASAGRARREPDERHSASRTGDCESDRRSGSERARHARPALPARHRVREGHSAPRRSRTPAARRGSKVRACWRRPTRAPGEPRKRSICWTSRRQTTRACCRRWRSSTSASGAGRTRRTRMRVRSTSRPATRS